MEQTLLAGTAQQELTGSRAGRNEGKVLIVDDEPTVRRSLHTTLLNLGFDIGEASSGEQAIEVCAVVHYDAVLLDVIMPGWNGIQTCAELRRMKPHLAILMISVIDDYEHRVQALEAGADDYVIKPFHIGELAARIRASLRRTCASPAVEMEDVIEIGDLSLNAARRLVLKSGQPVHLTPKEFDLLHLLMSSCGLPLTHERLLHAVWGPQYVRQSEYLRSFVRQLRKKLGDDAASPKYLLTESHVGYRFVDPAEWAGSKKKA